MSDSDRIKWLEGCVNELVECLKAHLKWDAEEPDIGTPTVDQAGRYLDMVEHSLRTIDKVTGKSP